VLHQFQDPFEKNDYFDEAVSKLRYTGFESTGTEDKSQVASSSDSDGGYDIADDSIDQHILDIEVINIRPE
jgi:hypothetical protein